MKKIVISFYFFILSFNLFSLSIYVSTNGSDSTGNGTIEKPYKTISFALTNATAGDEIILRGAPYLSDNKYFESLRIRIPYLKISSMEGEWAIIECPLNDENISSCITFDAESDIEGYKDSSGSELKRVEVIGGYYYGIKFETRWDWGNPNDRGGASNITIEDVIIHDTGNAAIKITPGCDDITIQCSEIYNTGRVIPDSAEAVDNVNGDRMIIRNTYIHNTTGTGLYFKGGSINCLVENNVIENTEGGGIFIGFDTSPEYFDLEVNPQYYESISGKVQNNIIKNTKLAGIGIYGSKEPRALNNTLINTAQEAQSPIYFGVTYQDWDDMAGRPPTINPLIYNNIIVQSENIPQDCVFIRYTNELGGLSSLTDMPDMDYNIYFSANSSCTFTDQRPNSYLENGNFSEWQNHINNDFHSFLKNPLLSENGHRY